MNFIYKALASLYRLNNRNRNKDIPYFSTLCDLGIFLFFILIIFLCLLNEKDFFDFWQIKPRYKGYLWGALIMLPPLFLISFLLPHKKLKQLNEELKEDEYDKWILIDRVVFISILTLMLIVGFITY